MAGVELATAYVSIVPDTKGLGRQLISQGGPQVSSSGASMGKMLGGKLVGALAAAGIGTAIVSQVKQGIDGAIAQAEAMNKVQVVFGDSAQAVQDFAAQGAKALGMSEGSALAYAGTLGNLLTATGVTDKAAADMSTTMVGLAADLGSFNNTSPEDALEALRAGLSGETEPLKRFGVNLNEAILKQEALRQGIYDGVGVLTPAQKAQAAYAVIMEQTAKAQGDFARTSDGVANKQRIVSAQWEDIRARIGEGFLPIISKVQDAIIGVLDKLDGGGLAGIFPPEVQAQFATFKDAVGDITATVMPTIREWYDSYIKPTADKIAAAFKPVAAEIIPTVTAIVDFVSDNWPLIQQAIEPVMRMVSDTIGGVMQFIGGIIRTVLAVIRGDWSAAGEGVKTAVRGIVDVLKSSNIGLAISSGFEIVKKVGGWFESMRTRVANAISDLWAKIKGKIDAIRDGIANLNPFLRHSPSLVDNVLRGVKVIGDAYGSLSGMSIAGPSVSGISAGYTTSAAPASGFGGITVYATDAGSIPAIKNAVREVLRGEIRSSMVLGGAL